MTCKDCLHYKMCSYGQICKLCVDFADKSEWVHLPCKVGDRVFSIVMLGGEYSIVVDRAIALKITTDNIYVETEYIDAGEIGYTVFLTLKEAEKALAKRSRK